MLFTIPFVSLLGAAALVSAEEACPPPGPAVQENIRALNSLQSNLKDMTQAVQGFDKSKGIGGALNIQRKESDVSSAADSVTRSAISLGPLNKCDSDYLADAASSASRDIRELVQLLGTKKGDFESVGVIPIVSNDLTTLYGKTIDWEKTTYSKVTCSGQEKLAPIWDQMNAAFAAAIRDYGGNAAPGATKPASCRQN